jgi:phage-related protein
VSNIYTGIKNTFDNITSFVTGFIKNGAQWGLNLVKGIADGIKAGVKWVQDAVSSVADGIKKFLGFSSPTEEGPGAKADQWMPNLFEMLNTGLEQEIPKLNAALAAAMNPSLYNEMMYPSFAESGLSHEAAVKSTIIIELDGRAIAQKTVEHLPRILRLKGAAR